MQSLANQFLVSMPKLRGSMFGDTVVYVWSHGERGAQGLVVNRPHELTLIELLHQLELPTRIAADFPVAFGGPVEQQRGFILHSDDISVESSEDAGDGLKLSYSREILELIAADQGPKQFLVALGYAGWGAGQLENELAESDWLAMPSCRPISHEVLFDVPLEGRLDRVATELGIDFALLGADGGYA